MKTKDKSKVCIQCSKVFQYKRLEQKLCSKECSAKFLADEATVQRICKLDSCGSNFSTRRSDSKVFCSSSCSATFNNANRSSEPKFCKNCDRLLEDKTQKLYCSVSCGTEFKVKEKVDSWLSGEWDATTSSGLSRTIAIYLKEKSGWRCQSPTCCVAGGWSVVNPTTGNVPVEIDHIDGNSFNNHISNLTVLCPNCHALTSTYKALNKNSGRTYRSRYKQYE